MREPRWSRGAYAQPPALKDTTGSTVTVTAAVECWRGTVDELCSPAIELANALGGGSTTQRAFITVASGVQQRRHSTAMLSEALNDIELDNLLAVRFEVTSSGKDLSGVFIARGKRPGLTVEVTGADRAKVMGATEIVFQRMMIGYVDRLGGWRSLALMAAFIAPLLLVGSAVSSDKNALVRIGVILIAAFGPLASGVLVIDAISYSKPLVVLAELPPPRVRNARQQVSVIYHHRLTRQAIGVLVALAIGALGSKLANYLPFP
jgi:hypothetical protein